jgi:hypothetical protein
MGRRPAQGGWGGGASEAEAGRGGSRPRSGADSGGPAAWRGARASAGRWTAESGRPAVAENPRGQRTGAQRKARSGRMTAEGTKKWPSAGVGGSLLLYIDTPLVPGRVTNRDKRGPFVMVGETTRD